MPVLTGLNIIVVLVSILFILIALIILIIYSGRSSSGSRGTTLSRAGTSATTTARGGAGGWGGYASFTPAEQPLPGEEEAAATSASGPGEPVDVVKSRVLLNLVKQQAVPLDILEQRVKADKEYIIRAIRELERQGLVRIEGDMILISERGEKIITKLREKYAEKEDWFEAI